MCPFNGEKCSFKRNILLLLLTPLDERYKFSIKLTYFRFLINLTEDKLEYIFCSKVCTNFYRLQTVIFLAIFVFELFLVLFSTTKLLPFSIFSIFICLFCFHFLYYSLLVSTLV